MPNSAFRFADLHNIPPSPSAIYDLPAMVPDAIANQFPDPLPNLECE